MSLLRGKGKKRHKEENELMETTMGMLQPSPTSPTATNTLPSKWQPGRQLQPPRSPGRGFQQSPSTGNGAAYRPRQGYSSLSSNNSSLPRPGGLSPTSPRGPSPGMMPGSPSSLSSNDSRRYRTWSPAAPMGTLPAPATLSTAVPDYGVSPSRVSPGVAPNLYSRPPAPVPMPDHIDGPPPNPLAKPLIKPNKPEKTDKSKVRKQFKPPEKKPGESKYKPMQVSKMNDVSFILVNRGAGNSSGRAG